MVKLYTRNKNDHNKLKDGGIYKHGNRIKVNRKPQKEPDQKHYPTPTS